MNTEELNIKMKEAFNQRPYSPELINLLEAYKNLSIAMESKLKQEGNESPSREDISNEISNLQKKLLNQ